MLPLSRSLAALLLSLLLLPRVHAETFAGTAVRILDGDTIEVLVDRTPRRVRLAGIDAPEKAQAFGARAKQALADLVGGREVQVDWNKRDKYGRTVGKVLVQGKDANLAMVAGGMTWWYREYASEQSPVDRVLYEAAERRARAERRGLWADPSPMPPWVWRHRPPPVEGYAAACPCGSGAVCTGPKGGRFCVAEGGKKRYLPRQDEAEVGGQ
jgi:endonuclease YncB( thermonuclease family)